LKSKGKLPKPEKITLKGAQFLHFLVKERSAQYATTLEQDSAEPVQMAIGGQANSKERRYMMAKLIRIGEKTILRQAEIALAGLVSQLGSSETDLKRSDSSPQNGSTKRRRMA